MSQEKLAELLGHTLMEVMLGMLMGAAVCHGFGLASSGAGPTAAGRIAVGACVALLCLISFAHLLKRGEKA